MVDLAGGAAPHPLTLHDKQDLFTRLVPGLLAKAHDLGFTVSFGETWRSNEEAARLAGLGKGILLSLHCDRLAVDLNLFKDGVWLTDKESHRPLGVYWEQQSRPPAYECVWGGSWGADGNHYSIAHGGRK